jgi:hypothetical protein
VQLSPEKLRDVLDALMAGRSWKHAAASVGMTEGGLWTWKKGSRDAEENFEVESTFNLSWPSDQPREWFHHLIERARSRRAAMMDSPLMRGDVIVMDGKVALTADHDEFGLPIPEGAPPKPIRRTAPPRRELAPASYSGHKPKAVPVYTGSALGDYLKANAPKSRPMTELERDLREKLKAGPKNGKPSAPVHIIRDQPDDAQREHTNQPSNETGLPRTAEVSREPASPPAYARPPRLDGARVPPPGGFRVR